MTTSVTPLRQKVGLEKKKRNVTREGRSLSDFEAATEARNWGSNTWVCEMDSPPGEVLLSTLFAPPGDNIDFNLVALNRRDGSPHQEVCNFK